MVTRRGSATSGCLSLLLVGAVGLYVAVQIGEPYFRYYRFRDAAVQEARFATLRPDDQIERNLWEAADFLGLPEPAYRIRIARAAGDVRIVSAYDDAWTLLRYTRQVHFVVDVSGQTPR